MATPVPRMPQAPSRALQRWSRARPTARQRQPPAPPPGRLAPAWEPHPRWPCCNASAACGLPSSLHLCCLPAASATLVPFHAVSRMRSIPSTTQWTYFAFFLGTGERQCAGPGVIGRCAAVSGPILQVTSLAGALSTTPARSGPDAVCARCTPLHSTPQPRTHPHTHTTPPARSCLLPGVLFLAMAFFLFLPMIILAPAKFAMTFSIGSGEAVGSGAPPWQACGAIPRCRRAAVQGRAACARVEGT